MRTGGFTDEFADRLTDGISEKSRRFRYFVAYAGLLALFTVFFIWNINAGSVDISEKEIFSILFLGGGDETQSDIIRQIRLPGLRRRPFWEVRWLWRDFCCRLFSGIHRGTVCFRHLLRCGDGGGRDDGVSPEAGPAVFLLGHDSGSICRSSSVHGSHSGFFGEDRQVIYAGGMRRDGRVYLFCHYGFFCHLCGGSDIVNLYNWSMGSFSGIDWDNIGIMSAVVGAASAAVFFCAKPIGAYQLGESYAQSVGVNVRRFRVVLILLSSLLAAVWRRLQVRFLSSESRFRTSPAGFSIPQTSGGHSGPVSVRVGVLPVLRSGGQDSVCADGDEHQHGDGHFRCAGRHLRPGEKAA